MTSHGLALEGGERGVGSMARACMGARRREGGEAAWGWRGEEKVVRGMPKRKKPLTRCSRTGLLPVRRQQQEEERSVVVVVVVAAAAAAAVVVVVGEVVMTAMCLNQLTGYVGLLLW